MSSAHLHPTVMYSQGYRTLRKHIPVIYEKSYENASPILPEDLNWENYSTDYPQTFLMYEVKVELNRVKSLLDDINPHRLMSTKNASDSMSKLGTTISKNYNLQHVNKGWMKCFEILSNYEVIDVLSHTQSPLKAFFNCELPGGFIEATTCYARKCNMHLTWYASSLHPDSESNSPLQDQYGLYRSNPDRWLMNEKEGSNGDMTDPRAVRYLVKETRKIFPDGMDVYACDGGMDVKKEYAYQEELHQALFLGEMLAMLGILKIGGNAVMKIYTTYTDFMLSLIAVMRTFFMNVQLYKPAMSKMWNTESYLILIDYKFRREGMEDFMYDRLEDVDRSSRAMEAASPLVNICEPLLVNFQSECLAFQVELAEKCMMCLKELIRRTHLAYKDLGTLPLMGMDMNQWLSEVDQYLPDK